MQLAQDRDQWRALVNTSGSRLCRKCLWVGEQQKKNSAPWSYLGQEVSSYIISSVSCLAHLSWIQPLFVNTRLRATGDASQPHETTTLSLSLCWRFKQTRLDHFLHWTVTTHPRSNCITTISTRTLSPCAADIVRPSFHSLYFQNYLNVDEIWYSSATLNIDEFNFVGYEIIAAVTVMSTIFWDLTPCSPIEIRWRFGRTSCLHLQGVRNAKRRSWVNPCGKHW
jgi:hypothetical protein